MSNCFARQALSCSIWDGRVKSLRHLRLAFCFVLFCFEHFVFPKWACFPWEIRVTAPKESQLQQSRATPLFRLVLHPALAVLQINRQLSPKLHQTPSPLSTPLHVCYTPTTFWLFTRKKADIEQQPIAVGYYYYDYVLAYSPVNRSGSPSGIFTSSNFAHKLNTLQNMHIT